MRFARSLRYSSVLLVLIACGCGGGGGGGSSTVNVAVSTDWTARGTSGLPTGASERIIVHPLSTPTTETTRVNLDATSGVQTTSIPLAQGKYIYHVDLYSGAAESGSVTGSLDTIVDTSVTTSVSIVVGKPISGINLGPTGESVSIGATGYVYAAPYAVGGAYTFAAPGDLSFASSATSVLTVTADTTGNASGDNAAGDVVGVLTGSANVTATAASTHVTSNALNVSVATSTGVKKKWTIMVFLNAANSLEQYALTNYLQMQQAVQGTDTQIVVAWKEAKSWPNAINGTLDWSFTGADDTRYYVVQPSNGSSIVGSPVKELGANVDMGSYKTLGTFIAYCKQNYPADRYLLDMWDHGEGWQEDVMKRTRAGMFRGVSYDQELNTHIDTWQMDLALANGNNVDILSYDACDMQSIECGYQVRNDVSYIVGSEDLTPALGYDYSVALVPFFTNASGASATLAQSFVDQMINDTAVGGVYYGQNVCQSVIDASKLNAVASAVDTLGSALLANKTTIGTIADTARDTGKKFDIDASYHMYYDIYSVSDILQNATGVPTAVATAAASLKTALQSAVVYNRYDSGDAGASGLSFDFSDSITFTSAISGPASSVQYPNLQFAKDYPHWYDWLLIAP